MNTQQVTIWAAGTVATANKTSDASLGVGPAFAAAAFQLVATSFNAADAVIKLQDSIDGVNWSDITGATITIASGDSSNMIRVAAFTGGYIRAVFTKGTNSAGTIKGLLLLKE